MDGQTSSVNQPTQPRPSTFAYPSQLQDAKEAIASLTKLLLESSKTITVLRRELRGEGLYQAEDGSATWVQVSKPTFVVVDALSGKPIREDYTMPDGTIKKVYLVNDEAIDEILSMLKSMGMNQITPLTNLDENTILDDLREFECKLAALLALKQKSWGIDKELLPMLHSKIKTMVQDARYQCCEGSTIKALQTTVSRIESITEGDKAPKKISSSPYQ